MTNNIIITYYDFANIYYSSFFLCGLFENEKTMPFKFIISKKIPDILKLPSMEGPWRTILFNICLFKIKIANEEFYFCIDTRDQCTMKNEIGYHIPLLKEVKYYFKVNYNFDEVKSDKILNEYCNKIIAVPLFFPLKMPSIIKLAPRVLPCKTINWRTKDIKGRIRALYDLVSLEEMMKYRNTNKDLDLFFVSTYYNQKHHSHAMEFRYEIMKEIKSDKSINSIVGFSNYNEVPSKYKEYCFNQSDTKNYLHNVSRAKVAIYVKGLHDCLSFKFGQLLFMGMPVIGQTIMNNKKDLYSNPYFTEQFAYDDPHIIVQKAKELLSQPAKLLIIGKANSDTIERKYTPNKVIADILSIITKN